MKRLLAALLAVVLALIGILVPIATAQDGDGLDRLQVRSIDTRDPANVAMVVEYSGNASALESATITQNGDELRPDAVAPLPGGLVSTVYAIDTSEAMDDGGALVQTREALAEIIRNAPEGQQIGIVSFGGTARVVQRLTADTDRLLAAVEGLGPTGGSALWNGIETAADMLDESVNRQGNVVVVGGGPNDSSTIPGSRARGSVVSAEAVLFALGLENRGVDGAGLRSIAEASGGTYVAQENVSAIGDVLSGFADNIAGQYVLTFDSGLEPGPVDLTLQVGDMSTSVSFVSGGVAAGASALRPLDPAEPGGVGFLRDNGLVLGIVLVLLAVGLGIYAVGSLIAPDGGSLSSMIDQYTETVVPGRVDDDDDGGGLARTAIIQRAVSLTEGFAERQGLLAKVEGMLERANLPLRAAEALFFYAVGVAVLVVLAFILTGNVVGALVVALLAALIPPAVVNFLASRRQKQFVALLPDTLQLLAGTLRAGYSLMQGVEAVSREVSEPMGKELRRVVTESRLGRPLEESLEASAERMDSADFSWAVMAIRIQREVGGNLAELLLTVADTMTQRERLRRDVAALTAEGKISAIVLGLLPIGLGIAMYLMNPDYISTLFDTTLGNFLLGGAILLAGVGFYWMKKVIEVDI